MMGASVFDAHYYCIVYAGVNNARRIRKALEPLLGPAHLSKSAVSRVVGRLKALFESWDQRDLSEEGYAILYLDGFHLKIRLARRVVAVPVLAVLGVAEDGTKVLISLKVASSEATSQWAGVLIDLQWRGLTAPLPFGEIHSAKYNMEELLSSGRTIMLSSCMSHISLYMVRPT